MFPLKIYKLDQMAETMWHENRLHHRAKQEFEFVPTYHSADILLGRTFRRVYDFMHLTDKAFMLYSHEPILLTSADTEVVAPFGGGTIDVMSVYTGSVYLSPLHYFPTEINFRPLNTENRRNRAAIFATFGAKTDYFYNGENRGLCPAREKLALYLHQKSFCDIYGRNWPENKVTGESRRHPGGWRVKKLDELASYRYCICFENLHWKNYVTEKFWDAVQAGCIPIYYSGSNGLNEVIDLSGAILLRDMGSFQAVYRSIKEMTVSEYEDRIGRLRQQMVNIAAVHDRNLLFDAQYEQFRLRAQTAVRRVRGKLSK